MRYKQLGNSGINIPVIGQGVHGHSGAVISGSLCNKEYTAILRHGIDLGLTFIDTAEVYDNGDSEKLIGKAIKGIRTQVTIATKVSPNHLRHNDLLRSVEGSLRRLNTDYIDLYQIHWPNPQVSIDETMRTMERLVQDGKVRVIGVSNFDMPTLADACKSSMLPLVSNQLEYNLFDRWIEKEILPYCVRECITVVAYSPLDKGRIPSHAVISKCEQKYARSASQIVLNWLTHHSSVVAIPQTGSLVHLRENAQSADFEMDEADYALLDIATWREPMLIEPSRIRLAHDMYRNIEEALDNEKGFCPAPDILACEIRKYGIIKPVRICQYPDGEYVLSEGHIRYWAWVIAFGVKCPLPAYIRI